MSRTSRVRNSPPLSRRCIPFGCATALLLLLPGREAQAGHDVFHIFTPAIEQGRWGLEIVNGGQWRFPDHADDHHHGDVRAATELGVHAYPTHFWMTKIAVEFEREVGGSVEPVAIASKNVLSLRQWTPEFLNVGWFTAVSGALSDEATNAIEFGPVATLSAGRAALTINPFLEQTFGQNREEGIAFVYAVRATYSLSESFSIGVEGYGQIEDIGSGPPISEQVHRIGPVIYFGAVHGLGHEPQHGERHGHASHAAEGGDWHAEIGLLFGLTDGTPDQALKLNVGLDF